MKPVILHISNDYPDHLYGDKTTAISHLVEATPQYRHVVYSLNRTNGWSGIASMPFGEDRVSVAYEALPKGIFWNKRLTAVARWIAADLKKKNIVPDLVQAHKLTVEGVIGLKIAKEYGVPLVCDIQGNTDCMMLRKKIDMRGVYRDIARYTDLVFPYAPWSIKPFKDLIGLDESKCVPLPVIPGFDTLQPSHTTGKNKLVTLIRLRGRKTKSIGGLLAAFKALEKKFPDLTLDIYGGGPAKDLIFITKDILKNNLENRVFLKGKIANHLLPQTLNEYSAMVMPSRAETYGLAYAEALFCGIPVLYSKGRAIDGYFNPDDIGYACDPLSAADIAGGIEHILLNESKLKKNIESMQKNGKFNNIRRAGVIDAYTTNIDRVLERHKDCVARKA